MKDFTNQYELQVIVNSRNIDEYYHTDNLTYIEGRPGSEYLLRLINNSFERVLMVPSVDGLSVFDGKPASLDSKGYIVSPRSTVDIPGWTLDNTKVAKFEFTDVLSSYSNRITAGTSNVGVIGVAVFREQVYNNNAFNGVIYNGVNTTISGGYTRGLSVGRQMQNASVNAVATAATPNILDTLDAETTGFNQSMGTGFGDMEQFKTTSQHFPRRDPQHPDALMVLYYDSVKGLQKRGINVNLYSQTKPNPFPVNSNGCTPPPNWVTKK